MKIGIFHRNEKFDVTQKWGGATYLENFLKICKINKWDVIDLHKSKEKVDFIFFITLGEIKDTKEKAFSKLRFLNRYKGVPTVLFIHGVKEQIFYKESYDLFKNFEFDILLHSFRNQDTIQGMKRFFRSKQNYQINLPFDLPRDPINFDKKNRLIVSPSRIDSQKKIHWILELAHKMKEDCLFEIWGKEKGVYWYQLMKYNPFYNKNIFKGGYSDFKEVYKQAAFGIDLAIQKTPPWNRAWMDKGKLQYVDIEMISQGTIPITFKFWFDGVENFHYIKLENPVMNTHGWDYDMNIWIKKIKSSKYDINKAKENVRLLEHFYSINNVSKKYKEVFR